LAYLADRCKGVAVSSVQIPCRSGSPQAVFDDGAGAGVAGEPAGPWADAVVGAEITTLPAAAAVATIIIGAENLLRMMISPGLAVG
jgi:hypothetical protein